MSEALLEAVDSCLPPQSGGFLKKSSVDDTTSAVVAEQVKLGSLLRHHELLIKLHAELPARRIAVEKELEAIRRAGSDLAAHQKSRLDRIQQLENRQCEIDTQFASLMAALSDRREIEALSIFQKEKVWELITRVLALRKAVPAPVSRDSQILANRLGQNEHALRRIDVRLEALIHQWGESTKCDRT